MARRYNVTFNNTTVAAAVDLVQIVGPSAGLFRILKCWVGCGTGALPSAQGLQLRARYLPATVTVGSGGTTGITPSKVDVGDSTCLSTTCATCNTTPATTNGTAIVQGLWGRHIYFGLDWVFIDPVPVASGEAFVFELLNAPTGTVTLSGGVLFEAMGA